MRANFYRFITALILCLVAVAAYASTPPLINYQGRLTDSSGEPVSDGAYDMTLTVFDALEGGQALWSEVQPAIEVVDGLFAVKLGSINALSDSLFEGPERYLEVVVNGQPLSPRTQFTSVGYSQRVATVDGASAGQVTGELRVQPTNFLAPGNAVTVVDELNNAVMEMAVDEFGQASISLLDPADSKASLKSLEIATMPGGASISFFDPADSKNALAALQTLDIRVTNGEASISFFDPADSKAGVLTKRVEMRPEGLIMFGGTELDTSLIVAPNGDIRGLGQITMGMNSSPGTETSVLGFENTAEGDSSAIGGGSANTTTGTSSTIGGGYNNIAGGTGAVIGGGSNNETVQEHSTVGGGHTNLAQGSFSTVGGGRGNAAAGDFATIPGGENNSASGLYSMAAGHRAKSLHDGSFVWADQTDQDFTSTAPDQFIVRASGGVGINTDTPSGVLDVFGPAGDGSVNLPNDAISAPEMLNEAGLASTHSTAQVTLDQTATAMIDLSVTTISVPTEGYIVVRGSASMEVSENSGANQILAQIDETAGGTWDPDYAVRVGTDVNDSPNSLHFFSLSTERVYTVPAGTYSFRFEVMPHPDNAADASTVIFRPQITALFFPTAYGAVAVTSGGTARMDR